MSRVDRNRDYVRFCVRPLQDQQMTPDSLSELFIPRSNNVKTKTWTFRLKPDTVRCRKMYAYDSSCPCTDGSLGSAYINHKHSHDIKLFRRWTSFLSSSKRLTIWAEIVWATQLLRWQKLSHIVFSDINWALTEKYYWASTETHDSAVSLCWRVLFQFVRICDIVAMRAVSWSARARNPTAGHWHQLTIEVFFWERERQAVNISSITGFSK